MQKKATGLFWCSIVNPEIANNYVGSLTVREENQLMIAAFIRLNKITISKTARNFLSHLDDAKRTFSKMSGYCDAY
ncbi:hypothetical protein [Flavobacterium sp. T12S277]|uniref:hypothetical protein n=1 Tax=Flavobacterium sp. T12S277 TaxID=3402752 RepID=UPI003ADD162F